MLSESINRGVLALNGAKITPLMFTLKITTKEDLKMIPESRPLHPGEFVRDLILDEFDLTQAQLANYLGVSRRTINQLVNGKRGMTAVMAWRLGKFTKTTPQLWMNMQIGLDLWDALHSFENEMERIQPYTDEVYVDGDMEMSLAH
jgi:addiction module HigA family antidote